MNTYNWFELTLSLLCYAYLINELRSEKCEQSLATWGSWILLDGTTGLIQYLQDGPWVLLAIYVAGSSIVSCFIYKKATIKVTWVEKCCVGLVIVATAMMKHDPTHALYISVLGVVIATFPQFKDIYLEPHKASLVYVGFLAVNVIATAEGKGWTMKERLYPMVCNGLCAGAIILGIPKYKSYFKRKPRSA